MRRVRVLVNPKSGLGQAFDALRRAVERAWDQPGTDLSYQFTRDAADGADKARRAADEGVDLLVAAGGDGTVNTIGRALIGSDVALAVIPSGSGNGFARHFGIPLTPGRAVQALSRAETRRIDVGVVDGRPFFVTCSMAWDAAIVRTFEKFHVRGILPYVLAGAYEFLEYQPRAIVAQLESGETLEIPDPIVFTIANLTQYGGGAIIAPQAKADDGLLELVALRRRDLPGALNNLRRFFDGTADRIPQVTFRNFRSLRVRRAAATPIQVDGELCPAGEELAVTVKPLALNVLVPRPARGDHDAGDEASGGTAAANAS